LGEPSTEGFLDPIADLGGGLETPGGDLLLELVELGLGQSARIALELQRAKSIEATTLVKGKPVLDGTRANLKQVGNFLDFIALVQPQQRGKAIVNPHGFLLATAFFNPFALQGFQLELPCILLHRGFSSFLVALRSTSSFRKNPRIGSISMSIS
jgi:hypothetical protein